MIYEDKTKVQQFFKNVNGSKVDVNSIDDVSTKMHIIFKISSGITHVLRYYYIFTYPISRGLKKYLTEIKKQI